MTADDAISLTELGSVNFSYEDTDSLYSEESEGRGASSRLCKRKSKDTFVYREGPAPLEDVRLRGEFKESLLPGALSNVISKEYEERTDASCSGLLNYFQKLANSSQNEIIDVEFVDSLLRVGADINVADVYGQTIMHEVAREWNINVAQICLDRFADIDKPDNYGRSPLHLACAVNYTEMIEWLVKNGGEHIW